MKIERNIAMNKTLYFLSRRQHRSLMAEGWAEKLSIPNWTFKSAGWVVGADHELTILAMKELCIDIRSIPCTRIEIPELNQASVIVKIQDAEYDEDISLPSDLEKKVIRWDLPNPRKRSSNHLEEWACYQEICDEIALKVKSLEAILPDIN
jgi:arsenate reductase (thioredoxin)